MLRQSTQRLFSFRNVLSKQILSSVGKRNLSSQKVFRGSDLALKVIGASIVVGGTTFISYKFFGKIDHIEVHHEKEVDKTPVIKPPPVVKDLPESVPYLIIGGGTAAFSASRAIRSNDPSARVLMISAEEYNPYMRPPLSKELWYSGIDVKKDFTFKQWNGRERNIYFEHEEFYLPLEQFETAKTGGISIVKGHKVVKIDATDRRVYLDNGQTLSYNKCLIATGGTPKKLEIFENSTSEVQDRLLSFRNIDDFKKLDEVLQKSKSITIIGGGFLGSELAFALSEKLKRINSKAIISQLFPENGILRNILPQYLSNWCTNKITDEGVKVISNASIKAAQVNNNQLCLTLTNGETINTDYGIMAVGLNPNVDLADNSQLEIDNVHGGYRVNSELQIRSNLWVAGDATCFYDPKLGRRRVEHHDHAVVSGRLTGENMTGAGKPYWHQSMFWSDLGTDIGFEAIGIVDSSLPTFAVFAKEDAKAAEENHFREPNEKDKYNKGVVFYLRNDTVVGIVLWNLYNNMHTARRVLNDGVPNQDLNEVAKLFSLHFDPTEETQPEEKEEEAKSN